MFKITAGKGFSMKFANGMTSETIRCEDGAAPTMWQSLST